MPKKSLNPHIPYNEKLKEKARQLRNNSTPAEIKFWGNLRKMPFHQQHPFNRQKPLGGFIVDFYCHSLGLVVEIDGDSHGEVAAKVYDQKRTLWLKNHGLEIFRFSNHEVMEEIDGVMETLQTFIETKQKEEAPQPPSEKGEFKNKI